MILLHLFIGFLNSYLDIGIDIGIAWHICLCIYAVLSELRAGLIDLGIEKDALDHEIVLLGGRDVQHRHSAQGVETNTALFFKVKSNGYNLRSCRFNICAKGKKTRGFIPVVNVKELHRKFLWKIGC